MSKRWVPVFAIFSLALPAPLWAQASISLAACNRLLDAGYDALPTTARQARLVQYDNCVKRLADGGINRNYSDIVRGVKAYETSARQIVFGRIAGMADTAVQLQQAEQRAEQAELRQRYEEESRAIELQITLENRTEMRARGQELLRRTREATAELQERHRKDYTELQDKIRDAYTMAEGEIARLVNQDLADLGQQHVEKLSYIGDWFDRYLNAAPDQSIRDYQATTQIDDEVDDIDEPDSPFSLLQDLFIYTSGLIGKDPKPAVTIDTPFGSIGIRG